MEEGVGIRVPDLDRGQESRPTRQLRERCRCKSFGDVYTRLRSFVIVCRLVSEGHDQVPALIRGGEESVGIDPRFLD